MVTDGSPILFQCRIDQGAHDGKTFARSSVGHGVLHIVGAVEADPDLPGCVLHARAFIGRSMAMVGFATSEASLREDSQK